MKIASALTKPKGIRNIAEGSIGGPIQKGKLFFFTTGRGRSNAWAGPDLFSVRPRISLGRFQQKKLGAQILDSKGNQILVPTTDGGSVALRQGMIFDPSRGNQDGTGSSVFSSGGRLNVIPVSRP